MKFDSDARLILSNGITALNDAVRVTLGPRGRNVVIARDNSVAITKDGVTVAREVHLENSLEDVGAQIIKQIANKVAIEAGDGTTTATVLAHSIFTEGNKMVSAGSHPMDLKRGIELASKQIISKLREISVKLDSLEMVKQVATISANNDEELGQLIADSIKQVGFDGIITIGESKTNETFVELVEGLQFNSGYLSPYFITNQEKATIDFEKPIILLYDGKITNIQDVLQYLDYSNKINRPLLIICDGLDGEPLNALLFNKLKGTIRVAVVKAPGFGDSRRDRLEDISAIVGGRVISQLDGTSLRESIATESVGSCDSVIVSNEKTMIIGGHGSEESRNNRISELKLMITNATNESQKLLLKERLSKFEGGVAIIKIGAVSEMEAKEKADRLDDALGATRAAIAEGIIAGGGVPLAVIAENLQLDLSNRDQLLGVEIIKKACKQPFSVILQNAGLSPEVIWDKIKEMNKSYYVSTSGTAYSIGIVYSTGYDLKNERYCNLIAAGILDPVKVTISALENAVSIAALLLTTDCLMIQKPKVNP